MGVAVVCATTACLADDQQAFELAKNPFDAGQFAEAHARLSALLDPALPPCDAGSSATGRCHLADADLVERTRALDAVSLLALKREADADAQIGKILRANPQYAPNAALFPQEVIDRFTTVRGALRPELEAIAQQKAREELARRIKEQKRRDADEKWIADLVLRAGEMPRVTSNSRWIAMVPFGVGQFQNGNVPLGVAFAAGEALFGGTSLLMVAIVNKLASTDPTMVVLKELNSRLRTMTMVNWVAFGGWAALTVAGVIQAQVAFVPERTTHVKRPVPPRPSLAPVASPVPGGAVLGVVGRF